MSEGRNVSNNEQLKSLRWEYAWYVGEAEEKTHGQFESSNEWRELGENRVPEGTVYGSAKTWIQLEVIWRTKGRLEHDAQHGMAYDKIITMLLSWKKDFKD